jgi:hypothetical protein
MEYERWAKHVAAIVCDETSCSTLMGKPEREMNLWRQKRIILRRILWKWIVRMWIKLNWLRRRVCWWAPLNTFKKPENFLNNRATSSL